MSLDWDWVTIYRVISKRRSVRAFKNPDEIYDRDISKILLSAIKSPSAKNLQPIEFILVKQRDTKKKLASVCQQKQPEEVPVCIVVIGNLDIAGSVGKISTHSITTEEKGRKIFIYMDAAAAIENMLIMATSLGIDSLWISSFEKEKLSRLLELPSHFIPLAVVCLGHRRKEPLSPRKVPLGERLHNEKFDKNIKRNGSYLEDCRKVNEIGGEYPYPESK